MDQKAWSLLDFSDCLLLDLLGYLDPLSLYNLSKLDERLEGLSGDAKLWRVIDVRDDHCHDDYLEFIFRRVNKNTVRLCVTGVLAIPMLMELEMKSFPENLTVLALEDQCLHELWISLNSFPKSLVELSLKNSVIQHSSFFFRKTSERMCNLKVLILDCCPSVDSSVVMSVSKYPKLEVFSLYKCHVDNSIPYFSIAGRHGYKQLKVFDVRLSSLGDPFLKSMVHCPNIQAFYLQNFDTSFVLDFRNRENELESSGQSNKVPNVSFNSTMDEFEYDSLISDRGIEELASTEPKEDSEYPVSYLYKDPYGPCTCSGTRRKDYSQNNSSENGTKRYFTQEEYMPRRLVTETSLPDFTDGPGPSNVKRYSANDFSFSTRLPVKRRKTEKDGESSTWIDDDNNRRPYLPRKSKKPPLYLYSQTKCPRLRTLADNGNKDEREDGPFPRRCSKIRGCINNWNDTVLIGGFRLCANDRVRNIISPDEEEASNGEPEPLRRLIEPLDQEPDREDRCHNHNLHVHLRRGRNISETNWAHVQNVIHMMDFLPPQPRVEIVNIQLRRGIRTSIKRLSFRGYVGVTDSSLQSLEHLNLDLLDVTYTSVTKRRIEAFLETNPNCRVLHKEFCVCSPSLYF